MFDLRFVVRMDLSWTTLKGLVNPEVLQTVEEIFGFTIMTPVQVT